MVYSCEKLIFTNSEWAAKSSTVSSDQGAKRPITTTVCVLHFVLHFFLLIKCALFRIILLCCEKMPPPKQDRHAPGPTCEIFSVTVTCSYVLAFSGPNTLPKWNIICYCSSFIFSGFSGPNTLPKWNIFCYCSLLVCIGLSGPNNLPNWNIFCIDNRGYCN